VKLLGLAALGLFWFWPTWILWLAPFVVLGLMLAADRQTG
jgi:hypothetical protein